MPNEFFYSSKCPNTFPRARTFCMYNRYNRKLDKKSRKIYKLSLEQYYRIISKIMDKITDSMVYKGFVYKLPYKLGDFYIVKKKPKIMYDEHGEIDYDKTQFSVNFGAYCKAKKETDDADQLKRCVYYNLHTNGYHLKTHWQKHKGSKAQGVNIQVYNFKAGVHLKQKIHDAAMNYFSKGDVDYYVLR